MVHQKMGISYVEKKKNISEEKNQPPHVIHVIFYLLKTLKKEITFKMKYGLNSLISVSSNAFSAESGVKQKMEPAFLLINLFIPAPNFGSDAVTPTYNDLELHRAENILTRCNINVYQAEMAKIHGFQLLRC